MEGTRDLREQGKCSVGSTAYPSAVTEEEGTEVKYDKRDAMKMRPRSKLIFTKGPDVRVIGCSVE